MLTIPTGLSDEERDIYKVCFKACEKLLNEGKTIAEAIDAAIAKYSFLVSDVNELRRFLYAEITVYSEPTVALIAEKYKHSDEQMYWKTRYKSSIIQQIDKQIDQFEEELAKGQVTWISSEQAWAQIYEKFPWLR